MSRDDNGLDEPLSPDVVKKVIRRCLSEEGTVDFTRHARKEMETDPLGVMTDQDVVNVLRGGVVNPGELRRDRPEQPATWRYPVKTNRMGVAVAFDAPDELVVVTAWRIREA